MSEEVLDGKPKKEINPKFNWTIWLATLIIALGILACLQNGIISELPVLISGISLTGIILLNIFKPEFGVIATSVLCVLGLLGICQFFPTRDFFGFGINGKSIQFEVYSLFVLIAHISVSSKSHTLFFKKLVKN